MIKELAGNEQLPEAVTVFSSGFVSTNPETLPPNPLFFRRITNQRAYFSRVKKVESPD